MKKKQKMRLMYHYNEPKNEEEVREQQRKIDDIYNILFEEVERINAEKGIT